MGKEKKRKEKKKEVKRERENVLFLGVLEFWARLLNCDENGPPTFLGGKTYGLFFSLYFLYE